MFADPVSILITDDDLGFRAALRGVIEPAGFQTVEASDGQEALEIVGRQRVHLILLDMHMPRLTGLETLRRVKQLDAQLPCILMSARADEQLVEQALRAQAYAVLPKPVSRQSIIENVHAALTRTYNLPPDFFVRRS